MRVFRFLMLYILLVTTSILAFGKVRVDYDHGVDFSKYKTFMWAEEPESDDPIMAGRVVEAINAQLIARGLEPVRRNADLCIRASYTTQEVPTYNTYYSGFGGWGWAGWGYGYGWGGPAWATTTTDFELQATTTVTLIDAESDKTVWQAVSQGDTSHKADKASKKATKNVSKMFEAFPPITLITN